MLATFSLGEFLLHIPCWVHFYVECFSYTSHAGFTFIGGVSLTDQMLALLFCEGVSLTHPIFCFFCFSIWEVSLTHRVLASFLSGEFLLNISCWLHFYVESFSYTLLKIKYIISDVYRPDITVPVDWA